MKDVREKHGVTMNEGEKAAVVNELESCLALVLNDGIGSRKVFLTPNEARYVATKLRRCARRVEDRIASA